jgi:hypothetical protein
MNQPQTCIELLQEQEIQMQLTNKRVKIKTQKEKEIKREEMVTCRKSFERGDKLQ